MQKTFLKFLVFELVERIARFRLLLEEHEDELHASSPVLNQSLKAQATALEDSILAQKSTFNRLFSESGKSQAFPQALVFELYQQLQELSQIFFQIQPLRTETETLLFLKDVLPVELIQEAGEQSVLITREGSKPVSIQLPQVLVDSLSLLQKNNPLGWLGLTQSYSRHLLENSSTLEALKLDLLKSEKKKQAAAPRQLTEALFETLLTHAINLRLLGPAYYFHALAEALLGQDERFLHFVEPALFFGLNHQNFAHKSLVILHEACERSKSAPAEENSNSPLSEEVLAQVYRVVEKLIPAKYAFQAKHLERAIQLQERLSQGILLSSTPLYPVEEVAENLDTTRHQPNFSIYGPLSMMTEYPHSPREIINAGWLHKMERGPVWLYTILNESRQEGLEKIQSLLSYQDHLLRKSIEVSEVHRVLLCSQ